MNVTAVNVFVEVDGKQCIALIDPRMADIFIASLPIYQRCEQLGAGVKLVTLPSSVIGPLLETRRAFAEAVDGAKRVKRDQGGAAVKPTMAELRNAGVRLADALDKACAEFNNFSCGMRSAGFADGEIDEIRFLLMQANAAYAIDLRVTYDDQYDAQGGAA